ncbi:hypothetical protein VRK_28690 [Vibrio sp. MEBiC08052]|nr:hypothetical protein VRK_28690 [Vibrio sp. MEBiC08052]
MCNNAIDLWGYVHVGYPMMMKHIMMMNSLNVLIFSVNTSATLTQNCLMFIELGQ